jgi:hypothetical protein
MPMEQPELNPVIRSSTDYTQVSATVRGAIIAASSVIIFFASQFFGFVLTSNDVITLATEVGTVAGAIYFLYGLLKKVVVHFGRVR